MTDGGIHTSSDFIKRLGSGQAESLDLDFFIISNLLPGVCSGKNAVLSEGEGVPGARNGWSDRRSPQLLM
jgi:hypothetical protein